ncbi:unnamed protein product [Gadus morhua 'NCC']
MWTSVQVYSPPLSPYGNYTAHHIVLPMVTVNPDAAALSIKGHWQRVDHPTGWELSVYIRANTSEALSSYFSLTSGQVFYSFKVSLRRKRDDDAVISHVCGCPWLTRGGQRAIKGAADEDLGGNPPLRIPSIQGVRGGGKYSGEGIDPACLFSVPQQLSSRSPSGLTLKLEERQVPPLAAPRVLEASLTCLSALLSFSVHAGAFLSVSTINRAPVSEPNTGVGTKTEMAAGCGSQLDQGTSRPPS